jgi:hypothetical protein
MRLRRYELYVESAPIAVAHLVDFVHREEILSASSSLLLVNGSGSAVGQLLAGAFMTRLSPKLLFVWFAAIDGMLASYAFYRFNHCKREVTPDDNSVPMVNTGRSSLDMHSTGGVRENWRMGRMVSERNANYSSRHPRESEGPVPLAARQRHGSLDSCLTRHLAVESRRNDGEKGLPLKQVPFVSGCIFRKK